MIISPRIPLLFFIFASFLGLFLRFLNIEAVAGVNYKFILHTHSHIALLGWGYLLIILFSVHEFLTNSVVLKNGYKTIFICTLVCVIGMFCTFPFQGYGLYSIIFSTLFLFITYWFTIRFWKDLNTYSKNDYSVRFIKAGLFYLVLSSIGPWSLGPLMAGDLKGSEIYNMAIYFYLHFLYNGFFVFTVLGLFIRFANTHCKISEDWGQKQLFNTMQATCIPSVLLSALWTFPPTIVFVFSIVIALVQLIAVRYLFKGASSIIGSIYYKNTPILAKLLFVVFIGSFSIKLLLQLIASFSLFVKLLIQFKIYFVIGYLHLVFLGIISCFLIWFGVTKKSFFVSGFLSKFGIILFLFGLVVSELVLFGNGMVNWIGNVSLPNYLSWIVVTSSTIPIGITLFYFGQLKKSQ